ncbi:MAG: tetratricopeptide repeat protein [Syntrophobacteraceae bacterium]
MSLRRRIIFAIFLTVLSGCLLWYSICLYILSQIDTTGLGGFAAGFFPEAQVLNGHSRYLALDPAGAAEYYKKAILAEPSLIDAWIGLVRVRIASEHRQEARKILEIITPAIDSISTWKWQELLFAYDLHDELYFTKCFNFILSYLPQHVEEAGWLSSRFWGGWEEVVPHVFFCNYPVFLSGLIDSKQPDAALALFKIMEKEGTRWEEKDQLRFCDFLISNDRLEEAKSIWQLWSKHDTSLIHDGGFESEPLNRAFGWRFQTDSDFIVERTTSLAYSGNSCLHVHFKGTRNISSDLVWQIVPVNPGTAYALRFVSKSSNLTTDRGVFLTVSGYKNEFKNTSKEVLGDCPWQEDKIEFSVPVGCEAVVLRVRRDESLKMDNKISGDYWLDSVELMER